MDTVSLFPTLSFNGNHSFNLITDDFTNWVSAAPLKQKNAVQTHLCEIISVLENLESSQIHNWRVSFICHDNAKEFLDRKLSSWLHECGIQLQVTVPYAYKQVGKAERMNWTIEEMAQTMLADADLLLYFREDIKCAVYILNCLPTSTLPKDMTPYEALHSSKPDVSHFRVFGCQCWFFISEEIQTKGGSNYREGIFVSYEEN
ncbi:retrotransposon unclassified [Moniliophthora roreri MCA 2997]|nr:retrotransposon unclassified [Moniliophthora roreri MCA 2997]